MFTIEELEKKWKCMEEYERLNMGLKFGEDFAVVANALRQSKSFMSLGMVITLLSSFELQDIKKQLDASPDKEEFGKTLFERPSPVHQKLA